MRSLVRWCLDRRPVVILATVLVLLGGILGATQLRQQLFPDFDFPFAIATLEAPGFDATTLDRQAAQQIERSVSSLEDVEGVTSVASDGQLRLYIELSYGSDSDSAQDELTKTIDDLDLPEGIASPEFAGGFQEQAVVMATIKAPDGDLSSIADRVEELRTDLEGADGVGRVDIAGASDPRIEVTLRPAAIARGITAQEVADAVEATQVRSNAGILPGAQGAPTGVVVEGPELADIATIRRVDVEGIPIGAIATVAEVDASDAGFATADGEPVLSLSVFRETGKDEVATVDATTKLLEEAEQDLGRNTVNVLYETASDIRGSIKGLIVEGSLGALFAVVVIFLFLRTLRGTLVAAISIPTSIVFGVLVAWMLGLTINIITLAGLTIAVGRVIDDGIVVLENIHKHLERGAARRQAMIDGTGEVATAIASSTIATAAVFLPIGLVGGLISEIFLSFSIIVTAALLASLLVAVTVIPVVGAYVLKTSPTPHDPEDDRLARWVVPATKFGIRWRWIVLPVAVITMVGTMALAFGGAIPTQFLPEDGTSRIYGTVQLPPGTSADDARKLLGPLDERIGDVDGAKDLQLTYGIESANAAFDPTIGSSTAEFFFNVDEDVDAKRIEEDLREFGLEEYPGQFGVQRLTDGPPAGTFQVNINGDDQAKIAAAAAQLREEVLEPEADTWGLVEIEAQAAQSVPQLLVRTRPDAGVAPEVVAAALAGVSGSVDAGTDGSDRPIVVSADSRLRADPAALGALRVDAGDGTTRALRDVATFETVQNPAFVNRIEGQLSGSITARLTGEDTAKVNREIRAAAEQLDLPAGVELDWNQGDQQFLNEMFVDMGTAMVVAIVLVFFVLVLFFGSIAQPFTILAPIMFSFIGSFGALIITGRALGLPAMIGQLLLIGIIVSNSILLVDATLRFRKAGVPRDEALVRAARLRVRPVLMTAAATIAALLPLSLGLSGEGGIISQSLGTVVIGGLVVATLLTLVIVPSVYRLFDRDHDMSVGGGDPRHELPAAPPQFEHAPLV